MKTKMKKISLGMIACVATLLFCSFIHSSPVSVDEKKDEKAKVAEFTYKTICEPLRVGLKDKNGSFSEEDFSRCGSGYHPAFATAKKELRTENDVFGTISVYKGCKPHYVCNFKICVDKGLALIKSAKDTEYVTVASWLKNQKEIKVVKL